MDLGAVELPAILLAIGAPVIVVWLLADALMRPDRVWQRADTIRLAWWVFGVSLLLWLTGRFLLDGSALAILAVGLPWTVIWALPDGLWRPQAAWDRVGQSKQLWAVVQTVTLVVPVVSNVFGLYYLVTIRPELVAAQHGAPSTPPVS